MFILIEIESKNNIENSTETIQAEESNPLSNLSYSKGKRLINTLIISHQIETLTFVTQLSNRMCV